MLRKSAFLLLGLIGSLFVLVAVIDNLPRLKNLNSGPKGPPVTVDLGVRTGAYVTTWQAQELMSAIGKNQNARSVTIKARGANNESVELIADFEADTLTRKHSPGSTESWRGHVIGRLMKAVNGGTLNDPV